MNLFLILLAVGLLLYVSPFFVCEHKYEKASTVGDSTLVKLFISVTIASAFPLFFEVLLDLKDKIRGKQYGRHDILQRSFAAFGFIVPNALMLVVGNCYSHFTVIL